MRIPLVAMIRIIQAQLPGQCIQPIVCLRWIIKELQQQLGGSLGGAHEDGVGLGHEKAYPHITNTMLTNTLRDLERLEIIHREQFNEIPPHVEYSLTEKGKELLPVFFEISKWGQKNLE